MKGLRPKSDRASAVEARISAVLAEAEPLLRIEHCTLEIADFQAATGELTVRIAGSCPDCAGSPAMFATAIEAHVKLRVPQVRGVRVIG